MDRPPALASLLPAVTHNTPDRVGIRWAFRRIPAATSSLGLHSALESGFNHRLPYSLFFSWKSLVATPRARCQLNRDLT
jgi:hypothetical protein